MLWHGWVTGRSSCLSSTVLISNRQTKRVDGTTSWQRFSYKTEVKEVVCVYLLWVCLFLSCQVPLFDRPTSAADAAHVRNCAQVLLRVSACWSFAGRCHSDEVCTGTFQPRRIHRVTLTSVRQPNVNGAVWNRLSQCRVYSAGMESMQSLAE